MYNVPPVYNNIEHIKCFIKDLYELVFLNIQLLGKLHHLRVYISQSSHYFIISKMKQNTHSACVNFIMNNIQTVFI